MPYFETKIFEFEHGEPYSTMCRKRSCYFDECREYEYSCVSIRIIKHEVVIAFSYPNVTAEDEVAILRCAGDAIYVVSGIIVTAVESCIEFDRSCLITINTSILSSNEKGKEVFLQGLRRSGLPEEIINACEVRVITRDYHD
ncbi:hypothetical protein [Lacrimispora sp.]|uniref:hypothetical protein n=1 Tax=Lacrimispora sp. TaxID=2719234 RepID=UPI0028AADEF8|nr:hypothetical protein [Lacrimispora sp.]